MCTKWSMNDVFKYIFNKAPHVKRKDLNLKVIVCNSSEQSLRSCWCVLGDQRQDAVVPPLVLSRSPEGRSSLDFANSVQGQCLLLLEAVK